MGLVELDLGRARGVAVVTLNDPEHRNTMTSELVSCLVKVMDAVEADPAVGAVIVTGAPPAFCAGAHLGSLAGERAAAFSEDSAAGATTEGQPAGAASGGAGLRAIYEGFLRVARCPLPTVAAVNGAAVGAGMNLALACDLRVAGRSARFDARFLDLGLHPGGGHTYMLRGAVGLPAAAAMVLFGQILSGEEAAARGLAWGCVPDAELLEAALLIAERAASAPRELAVRAKETLAAVACLDDQEAAVDLEIDAQLWSLGQPFFAERLARLRQRVSGRAASPSYPPARLSDVADDHHGETVPDPYRWLEDPTSDETKVFVEAQRALAESYLASIPGREALRQRLSELWAFPRAGVPFERGGRWFQFRNTGLEDQDVLYAMNSPEGEGSVLLDPNLMSPDGTVAVSGVSVSHDGALVAYATSSAGSDWLTWRVRGSAGGSDLADVTEWSKFSAASWLGDGSGYFYGAPARPAGGEELRAENRFVRIFLHRLGEPQESDSVVFEAPDEPEWLPHASVTDDGEFLVVSISRGTFPESRILVGRLDDYGLGGSGLGGSGLGGSGLGGSPVDRELVPLVDDFSALAEVVTNVGDEFFVDTDLGAPRRRVVAISLASAHEGASAWREVVPEMEETLVGAHHCGSYLVCHYLRDAHSVLRLFGLDGAPAGEILLDGIVSLLDAAGGDSVRGRPGEPVFYFRATSFLDPGAIYSHDLRSGMTSLVRASEAPIEASAYVTEQVFVTSNDGTAVPLFLSHRRDVVPNGEVPVLLTGYGGFNISLGPEFRVAPMVFMEGGGVFALAVLRGGGEYGKEWHDAGRLAKKQNVFDDFSSCARWLGSESGWSRPGRLAISGRSNGGLLVAACANQHPELFGAVVPEVGVLDMLRFQLFTIGWAWTSDFGDPSDPQAYEWLRAYSPLHNLRAGVAYPPTLVMTGDHDDRVVPAHSYKYVAALQAAVSIDGAAPAGPILLRVETSAGHGAGKPVSKQIAERADFLAFLERALGT